jgi:1-acyl-sn-glycerol-3-phosphate acyltransferase
MNRQPYQTPPQSWPPRLWPFWVRLSRAYRRRQLVRQQIVDVRAENIAVVSRAVSAGQGVLITPNHSVHYDAAALYVAADEIEQPLYFMTAWQVFGQATRGQRWAMQRLGCFSIDRESNDRQAFKQAVTILQEAPVPLVIFPEGEVYHTNDLVTPLREGAAAIALAAARRAERDIVIIPCGIRFTYLDDPRPQLAELLARIEDRLYLRVSPDLSLVHRIHRIAEAGLALKELDYLGQTRTGSLRQRVLQLTDDIVSRLEQLHGAAPAGSSTPERVKALRQTVIKKIESGRASSAADVELLPLQHAMEDLFLAMQLYSYHGEYLLGEPSIERIAETVDKMEEDFLGVRMPTVRGRRRARLQFGEPIAAATADDRRGAVGQLTQQLQQQIQSLLDATRPAP